MPNLKNFATCKQYHCKFATVQTKNGIIFIVFLFCFLSHLSSLHLCFLSSVLYEEWYKFAPILFSLTSSPISHRLHFASSSPISLGIVIIIADRNRRWGEIGVFITIVGINVEILIVGISVEVRWDLDRGLPVLAGFGCRCKWIRGFGLAVLVVSWVLVVFSRFELLC